MGKEKTIALENSAVESQTTVEFELDNEDICEAAGMGLWKLEIYADRGKKLYCNPVMLQILGFPETMSPEEVAREHFERVVPDDMELFEDYTSELIEHGSTEIVYRWIHPVLGERYIRCGGTGVDRNEQRVLLKGYHQDVTEILRFQLEQLERQRFSDKVRRHRFDIIDTLSNLYFGNWFISIPRNTVIQIECPEQAVEYFANTKGEVDKTLAVICEQFVEKSHRVAVREFLDITTLQERLKGKKEIALEYLNEDQEWCCMHVIGLQSHQAKSGEFLLALEVISGQKKQELEAKEKLKVAYEEATKANVAKSEFLSRMSHDIRTPLNGMLGMLEISKKNIDNKEKLMDCYGKMEISAKYLLSLISDILDMSKLESGRMRFTNEPFNLRELLDSCNEILKPLAKERGITLTMQPAKELPVADVTGSVLHVRQVIINIASNAIKYNNPGGYVNISFAEVGSSEKLVLFHLIVEDNGIGMSEEFQEHMFEAFTQENIDSRTTYQGSGLGLAIVHKMIHGMRGSIEVRSKLGVGSTFTVSLPLQVLETQTEAGGNTTDHKVDFSDKRVLLVEDNELNMEIAEFMLEETGASYEKACNGKEAVELVKAHKTPYYDMIFMDVMMPELNGYEATKVIRALPEEQVGNVPIIAMTANAFAEDVDKAIKTGMNAHLAKPLDSAKLIRIMKRYLC